LLAIQLARKSQNTLTVWTHFQKTPQSSSLPEEPRTHSLPGQIFRRNLISHPACQKKPEHTHKLDTFSERASSAIQLARRSQNTFTFWTHFYKEPYQPSTLSEEARTHSQTGHIFRCLISHPACQKKPKHTHSLDTFSGGASSTIQLARRSQKTLTYWKHFQKQPYQPSSLQKPEYTHFLDTFSKEASSAIQLVRRSQNTLTA